MSDMPTDNTSRRSVLKTASLGITGASVMGAFTDRVAAADQFPYDKIKSKEDSTAIRYTKNAVWNNNVKISVSSNLHHIGSFPTEENKNGEKVTVWNHKFGINTQAVAYHTDAEELRPNIKNHSTKAQKLGGSDSSLELDGRPVGSNSVGATPSSNTESLEEVFTTSLRTTASLLNAKFAVASAATTIANSLKEAGSRSCKEASDCINYEWTYFQDKEEVSHQTKWWAYTTGDDWGNFEVATQADSETAISFVVTVGDDYGNTRPRDPPSSTGTQDATTADNHPNYITRDELDNLSNNRRLTTSGIPAPEDMDADTAERYGVEEFDSPKTMVIRGEEKEVTHMAKNMPIQIYGLEPKEKFK